MKPRREISEKEREKKTQKRPPSGRSYQMGNEFYTANRRLINANHERACIFFSSFSFSFSLFFLFTYHDEIPYIPLYIA